MTLEQRLRLGALLVEVRRARSLTVAQVARDALGYGRSHAGLSRVERGVLPSISVHQLSALSRFFDTDLQAYLSQWQNAHFSPYQPTHLEPHALQRTLQLHGALRFGAQWKDRLKRFESMLPPERLQAWEDGEGTADLDTLDRLSKYFDLTRTWLPEGV